MKQLNDLSNAELNTLHSKLEKDTVQAHSTDRIKDNNINSDDIGDIFVIIIASFIIVTNIVLLFM